MMSSSNARSHRRWGWRAASKGFVLTLVRVLLILLALGFATQLCAFTFQHLGREALTATQQVLDVVRTPLTATRYLVVGVIYWYWEVIGERLSVRRQWTEETLRAFKECRQTFLGWVLLIELFLIHRLPLVLYGWVTS